MHQNAPLVSLNPIIRLRVLAVKNHEPAFPSLYTQIRFVPSW